MKSKFKNKCKEYGGVRAYVRKKYAGTIRLRMLSAIDDGFLYCFTSYFMCCASFSKSIDFSVKECLILEAQKIIMELNEEGLVNMEKVVFEILSDILSTTDISLHYYSFRKHIKKAYDFAIRDSLLGKRFVGRYWTMKMLFSSIIAIMTLLNYSPLEICLYLKLKVDGKIPIPSYSSVRNLSSLICLHPDVSWIDNYIKKIGVEK